MLTNTNILRLLNKSEKKSKKYFNNRTKEREKKQTATNLLKRYYNHSANFEHLRNKQNVLNQMYKMNNHYLQWALLKQKLNDLNKRGVKHNNLTRPSHIPSPYVKALINKYVKMNN